MNNESEIIKHLGINVENKKETEEKEKKEENNNNNKNNKKISNKKKKSPEENLKKLLVEYLTKKGESYAKWLHKKHLELFSEIMDDELIEIKIKGEAENERNI